MEINLEENSIINSHSNQFKKRKSKEIHSINRKNQWEKLIIFQLVTSKHKKESLIALLHHSGFNLKYEYNY